MPNLPYNLLKSADTLQTAGPTFTKHITIILHKKHGTETDFRKKNANPFRIEISSSV